MNLKKKIVSILSTVAITASILPIGMITVSATGSQTLSAAPVGVYHWTGGWTYGTGAKMSASTAQVHTGNHSLCIEGLMAQGNSSISAKVPFKKAMEVGKTYRVSFWIYTTKADAVAVYLGNASATSDNFNNAVHSETAPDGILNWKSGGAWHQYTMDYTATVAYDDFQFRTWDAIAQHYLDDLSVREVIDAEAGTLGDEMVINGDFETVKDKDYAVSPSYWTATFTDDGGERVLGTHDNFIASTDMDSHSGSRSLLINMNNDIDNKQMDVFGYLNDTLDSSKTYQISFWAKRFNDGQRATSTPYMAELPISVGNGYVQNATPAETDSATGWYKYTGTATGVTFKRWSMRFWASCSQLVDDIELYEYDTATGSRVGDNLIINGGFEEFVPAFDADAESTTYNNNWDIYKSGLDGEEDDYVCFEDMGNGNYAMHVNYEGDITANTFYMLTNLGGGSLTSGTEYTLEYDAKYTTGQSSAVMMFPEADWVYITSYGLESDKTSKTELGNGWVRETCTFSATDTRTSRLTLLLQARTNAIFDNFKLYATGDASKTNLINDGDFSGTKTYNTTDLYNVVAYSAVAANTATVSWTNPHTEISDVVVKVDDTAVTATVDLAADAFNQIVLSDLTAGTTYAIEVSATINGETETYNTSVTAGEERGWITHNIDTLVSDKWSTILSDGEFRDGNGGYANSVVSIEEETDNSYVKVTGNIPTKLGNTFAGIVYNASGLDQTYYYKLKFKAKGENVNNFTVQCESNDVGWGPEGAVSGNITDEWKTFEVMLDYYYSEADDANTSYSAQIEIFSENFAGWYAIDDVELTKCYDSIGEDPVDGANLIENGTFDIAEPVMADPVLTLNGGTETTLKQGTMNVAVSVENISDISLIVALYKDSALKTVSIMEKTTDGTSQLYETGLIVPDMSDGVYTAKVMYWNSLTGLVPLRGAYEITE